MWARVVEVMLGIWLLMSPFIFQHESGEVVLWCNDLGGGFALITLALAACWHPLRFAHVGELLVAGWLLAYSYLTFSYPHADPALQNEFLVGLLIAMFAILPTESFVPPRPWRAFYHRRAS